jgi:hypothetical protein
MSKITVFSGLQRVRDVYKKVPVAPPGDGFTHERDGQEAFTFEVSLDMERIHSLAFVAARNKTGVAKRGGLTIKITSRKKV